MSDRVSTFDVVIPFWKKHSEWHAVRVGLTANLGQINAVHVVHDCAEDEKASLTCPEGLTMGQNLFVHTAGKRGEEEHFFGVSRCWNTGVLACSGQVILGCDADVVLGPQALWQLEDIVHQLRKGDNPHWLLALPFDGAEMSSNIYPPQLFIKDPRITKKRSFFREYLNFRGGLWCMPREDFLAVGGWNEEMTEYGAQDLEFFLRWREKFPSGVFSYFYAKDFAWHLGRPDKEDKAKLLSKVNTEIVGRQFIRTFNGRVNLACGTEFDPLTLNVDAYQYPSVDITLDCVNLSWIDDSSVSFIRHEHFFEHINPYQIPKHIEHLFRVLRPGGELVLAFPDIDKLFEAWREGERSREEILLGVFSNPSHTLSNPLYAHQWGWTKHEVEGLLESAGFDIEESGDEWEHESRRWRDTRIIASKPELEPKEPENADECL